MLAAADGRSGQSGDCRAAHLRQGWARVARISGLTAGSAGGGSGSLSGVRWLGWAPGSGYGDATAAYLSGLRQAGIDVAWTTLGWSPGPWRWLGPSLDVDVRGLRHEDIANREIDHEIVVVHSTPIRQDLISREWGDRPRVAFTAWETDRLPAGWVSILNRYDAVFVPSRFSQEVCTESGVATSISVIPHPARRVVASDAAAPADRRPFTFYVIASWTTRKAIVDTVEAYLQAFDVDDEVRLVVHTGRVDQIAAARATADAADRASTSPTWLALARMLAGRRRLPEIILSTEVLPEAGIEALHRTGDCFVSLSRGEGFGLGAFDAAAFGNPSVITGWGGWLDYLPDGYPYAVDYDLVPAIVDLPDAYFTPQPGERWAHAHIGHGAALMRRVFENRDEAAHWGDRIRAKVAGEFDLATVTVKLVNSLAAVRDAGHRPTGAAA
jgi:glycosyltransferase involved in cell wall biosynthesis